jgi:hypothetical protein
MPTSDYGSGSLVSDPSDPGDLPGREGPTPIFSAASDCMCASFSDIADACCASKFATALTSSFKCMWPVPRLAYDWPYEHQGEYRDNTAAKFVIP